MFMKENNEANQDKKYKLGYISGVFDLFHVGHLNILRHCKKYCEYLIVAVNSDENVKQYKGKMPIISERDRMEILRELRCVDDVVLKDYHNSDIIEAYNLYKFDIMFCGDDHREELIEVKSELQRRGSDILFFPYTKGISSTMLKKKIGR